MSSEAHYFARGLISGFGNLYFLKVLRQTSEQSLLGTLVEEGDDKIFGLKEFPLPFAYGRPGAVQKQLQQLGLATADEIVVSNKLAPLGQVAVVKKSAGAGFKGPFPGAPAGLGVTLRYEKVVEAVVEIGRGAELCYIPRELIHQLLSHYGWDIGKLGSGATKDHMIVDRLLLVRELHITVTSSTSFGGDFEAAAAEVGSGALSYVRKSDRAYQLQLRSETPYLAALGGVQWEKLKG